MPFMQAPNIGSYPWENL